MTARGDAPAVSIVVPNLDGARFLGPCLDSLARLDYPSDHVEVIVVDNGSTDDSRSVAERSPLNVRWEQLDTNRGFAGASDHGARTASSDLVAFLNNDMVVEPGWLTAMVDAHRRATGPSCVAGMILDRSGDHVDFAGSLLNFHGFGDQPGFGRALDEVDPTTDPLPFPCGGSMLLAREVYLDAGGFDTEFFAYFEDVDLGWRLNVLGIPTVLAPAARVRHHHHGTSRRMAPEQKTLLLERNALRSIVRNVGDEHVHRVLAGAVMLLVARALDESGSSRARYAPFARRVGSERVPASSLARLHAVVDLMYALPELLAARADVQSKRERPDQDVFRTFGAATRPIGSTSEEYDQLMAIVTERLGIDDLFAVASASNASSGRRIGGPGRRRRSGFVRRVYRKLRR